MSVFSVKPIKPKKLKVAAIRLEILNALRKEGRLEKKLLEGTVRHWKRDKPSFEFLIGLTGQDASLLVGPAGGGNGAQKWRWIDEGTPGHWIRARRAPYLRFKVGGRSGSRPNTLAVSAATPGTQWVSKREVWNPGITSRNWSIVVLKMRQNPFFRSLNEALARGLKKAS